MYLSPIHHVGDDLKDEASGVWYESKRNSSQFKSDIVLRDIIILEVPLDHGILVLRTIREYEKFDHLYGVSLEGGFRVLDWGKVQNDFNGIYLIEPSTRWDWTRFYEGLDTLVVWEASCAKKIAYFKNAGLGDGQFDFDSTWVRS